MATRAKLQHSFILSKKKENASLSFALVIGLVVISTQRKERQSSCPWHNAKGRLSQNRARARDAEYQNNLFV